MSNPVAELPFVWPDSRRLAGCIDHSPDFDSLFGQSQIVLGVVHSITQATVSRLHTLLTPKPVTSANGNGDFPAESAKKKVRLIVTVYPTCPTRREVLIDLVGLQQSHPSWRFG